MVERTWLAQQSKSEVDVILFVCYALCLPGQIDDPFSDHVEKETCKKHKGGERM